MKRLSFLHNNKTEKYAIYYSAVLTAITATVFLFLFGIVNLVLIEAAALFFEGFLALAMLARHKKTEHAFNDRLTVLSSLRSLSFFK